MDKAKLIAQILEADDDRLAAAAAALVQTTGRRKPIQAKQACEILGVCRKTLLRFERMGKLHRITVSARKIRFDLAEVERLAYGEGSAE